MTTQDTSLDAFEAVRDAREDVSLRYRVAHELSQQPMTTNELGRAIPKHSANAIRPRVNELVRMGCVERRGKRENPSGHDAYVHHLTPRGKRYLAGDIDPEPMPTVAEQRRTVVAIAREYVRANADRDILHLAVEKHDDVKAKMDPDWSPPEGDGR